MTLAVIILIVLALLFWAEPAQSESVPDRVPATTTPVVLVATSTPIIATSTTSNIGVKELVEKEFAHIPKMIAIVRCESRFRQFNKWGTPLISHTSDVGVMQINKVHWARAKKLGLDIHYSVADNIKMGKIILKEQGIGAWYAPTTCK